MRTRPVVVLTGARQRGKTALVRRLFPQHAYVTLDLPSEAEQAELEPARFLVRHPSPLIVDEVQYAPKLLRHLKCAVDARRTVSGQFLLTGSQPFEVMAGVTESLAGRADVLQLATLSYAEVLRGGRRRPSKTWWFAAVTPNFTRSPNSMPAAFSSRTWPRISARPAGSVASGEPAGFRAILRAAALRTAGLLEPGRFVRRRNQSVDGRPVALGPRSVGNRNAAGAVVLQSHEVIGRRPRNSILGTRAYAPF